MKRLRIVLLAVLALVCVLAAPGFGQDSAPAVKPREVYVGVWVTRVHEVAIKEHRFVADFWVWFRWKGEDLDPLATFDLVDGTVRQKTGEQRGKSLEWNYATCRVEAEITKYFDVSAFPLDDHVLHIAIEDAQKEASLLRYVADTANSGVAAEVQVPGWAVQHASVAVADHAYTTNYGDISLPTGQGSAYSRFTCEIPLVRPGLGYFAKMFFGLLVAVAIALLAFFIRPTDLDPRFGLGVGAIFAAVGSLYITSSALPDTNILTMSDKLHILGFAAILVSLVESTVSLHKWTSGDEAASRRMDRRTFWIVAAGYLVLSAVVVVTR